MNKYIKIRVDNTTLEETEVGTSSSGSIIADLLACNSMNHKHRDYTHYIKPRDCIQGRELLCV